MRSPFNLGLLLLILDSFEAGPHNFVPFCETDAFFFAIQENRKTNYGMLPNFLAVDLARRFPNATHFKGHIIITFSE